MDRADRYIGRETLWSTHKAQEIGGRALDHYAGWAWWSVPAPGHKQSGLRWMIRRYRLRRWMKAGGILVIVGAPRSGKTCLLERLGLRIVNNARPPVLRDSPFTHADLPSSGLFAIDDTYDHNGVDIVRVLGDPALQSRGFALVFQTAEAFRGFDIWDFFASRKLLILELSQSGASGHGRLVDWADFAEAWAQQEQAAATR
ncbi:hypothetical protein L6Q21_09725 [Sandaracinobacter sp. RS1-74]|uniref:hypothetical protein n=1 Tax=Sandaracinobacteroides sayramensis TaxID=2913411 RepID=UPI001EDB17AE|nr:hypothetical protein [Sandaracinobacteroides sayramensis]MCG2841258.1 hypothetical protein [Sandaracinobacteroides sayramensis]